MITKNDEIPGRIAALPRDEKQRPVPYFVAWPDGKADFRVVDGHRLTECYANRRCWICGQKLGAYLAFVVGPMCTVNRISAEPPSHYECALYAVRNCPFLATPQMHRRERDLPEGVCDPAGVFLKHNPAVMAIWVAKSFKPFVANGGVLVRLEEPVRVEWYKEGRRASRAEVADAMAFGAPKLYEVAGSESSMKQLQADLERAKRFWPSEVAR